jgi:probable F420-dependent oxidoreductase
MSAVCFGVKLPGLVPRWAPTLRDLGDLVVEFERLGFDDVMDGEHILFAPQMHHPGGSGNMVHGRDRQHSDRCDSLLLFAALAPRTTRIRFVSAVVLAAAHNFAILARQAATLDQLSAGRFTLGVGAGWFAGEFEAMGIPPAERAARLEEIIRACRALWSGGPASFEGRWISFREMLTEPAPYTPGGVPVWWAGDASQATTARRVVTLGDGWIAREAAGEDEITAGAAYLRRVAAEHGRDPATVGMRVSLTATADWDAAGSFEQRLERAVARVRRLSAVGVTHFNVPLNYYGLDLDSLGEFLKVLRESTASSQHKS